MKKLGVPQAAIGVSIVGGEIDRGRTRAFAVGASSKRVKGEAGSGL